MQTSGNMALLLLDSQFILFTASLDLCGGLDPLLLA
jgi:hypothetical protein